MAYPTTANFKTWKGISGSGEDTQIGWDLEAAIALLEKSTGRKFISSSATRKFFGRAPWVGLRRRRLFFHEDNLTITTLTNGDLTVITATYYQLLGVVGHYHGLELLSGAPYRFAEGADGTLITVAGTWGYLDSDGNCPDLVFDAILQVCDVYYRARAQGIMGDIPGVSRQGQSTAALEFPPILQRAIDLYKRV